MTFEDWYDKHFGTDEEQQSPVPEPDPSRLDYSPTGDPVEQGVGTVLQSVRDAPGWLVRKARSESAAPLYLNGGGLPALMLPRVTAPVDLNREQAIMQSVIRPIRKAWDFMGDGPSAREQEQPPQAGGGAGSNELRQLWDRTPPLEPIRTEYMTPNFESNLPQITAQPLPSPPYVGEGIQGRALRGLFNEVRQGVLPDEAIAEIRRNPMSIDSLGAYLNAAISLSMGEGGERMPLDVKPGAVPEHVWNSWKPLDLGPGKTYVAGQGGEIRVDPAGNHYQMEGSHYDKEAGQTHVIAKPVEAPGSGTSMTPEDVNNMLQTLHSQDNPPSQPLKPEPGSMWDQWSKLHGGLKPDFGTKPDLGPKPGEPGSDEHYTKWLTDRNLPDNDASNEAYWQSVGESDKANMEKFLQDNTVDFEVQPDMTLEQIYDDMKANPEKSDFWSNLPGPKYVEGRGMAMPYSDEGEPYLPPPPPPEKGLTPYNPRNPPNLPPPPGISDDLWLQEHFGTGGATDRTPPNVDPLDSMLSDWAKYMDEKGIDYGQNEPPAVDPQIQDDFDKIRRWQDKQRFLKNRFNWEPPPGL